MVSPHYPMAHPTEASDRLCFDRARVQNVTDTECMNFTLQFLLFACNPLYFPSFSCLKLIPSPCHNSLCSLSFCLSSQPLLVCCGLTCPIPALSRTQRSHQSDRCHAQLCNSSISSSFCFNFQGIFPWLYGCPCEWGPVNRSSCYLCGDNTKHAIRSDLMCNCRSWLFVKICLFNSLNIRCTLNAHACWFTKLGN